MSDKDVPGQAAAEDRFYVKTFSGTKVTDKTKQEQVIKALTVLAESGGQAFSMARPKFSTPQGKGTSLSPIMGGCAGCSSCCLCEKCQLLCV